MDKQEKKRDVAVFTNMLKELMNEPYDDLLVTLDRDLQHFLYGRIAVLVKHNEGKPIGSIADISAVVGAAYAGVLAEFTKNRVTTNEEMSKLVYTARDNLMSAFETRAPVVDDAPPVEPELKKAPSVEEVRAEAEAIMKGELE